MPPSSLLIAMLGVVGSWTAATSTSPPRLVGGEAAKPSPCRYEENCDCAVPGITLRWKAAYCMYLGETEDLESEDGRRCLARPDPAAVKKAGACEQNLHWKTMICRLVHDKEDVQKCVRDEAFVPRFVEGIAEAVGGPAPPVPFFDWGACPFECCTYGTWTARSAVNVHADRSKASRVVFTVSEGEAVEAQTGVAITSQPARLVMSRELVLRDQASSDSEPSRARAGDVVYLLTARGEGHFAAWHEGRFFRSLDVSFLDGRACAQAPPADSCPGQLTSKGRSTWWIKLRNGLGQVGWTADADAFGGKDACS